MMLLVGSLRSVRRAEAMRLLLCVSTLAVWIVSRSVVPMERLQSSRKLIRTSKFRLNWRKLASEDRV